MIEIESKDVVEEYYPPCPVCGGDLCVTVANAREAPRKECPRHGAVETEREREAALAKERAR